MSTESAVADIWVVADHAPTRVELNPLLAGKGYTVLEIDCGADVVKRIRFHRPRLVIIDCGMADSFDTLDQIRAEPRYQSIPVLMFTSADEDVKQRALLKGADGFVGKRSLDWLDLLGEVVRLAGPPRKPTPNRPTRREPASEDELPS